MNKYLRKSVEFAQTIGTVDSVSMEPANKWFPPHIELGGKTPEGKSFLVTVNVGDPLPQEKKEDAENAETVQ